VVGQQRVTDRAEQQLEVARGVGSEKGSSSAGAAAQQRSPLVLGPGEDVVLALGVNGQPRAEARIGDSLGPQAGKTNSRLRCAPPPRDPTHTRDRIGIAVVENNHGHLRPVTQQIERGVAGTLRRLRTAFPIRGPGSVAGQFDHRRSIVRRSAVVIKGRAVRKGNRPAVRPVKGRMAASAS